MLLYDMPGHLIRRCHQISVGIFHDICGEQGLTPIQFAVLWGIGNWPETDQIRLSRSVGIDRATIGNVLDRLEGRGYIRRTADARDRRIKRLALTPEGRDMLAEILPRVEQVQERLLAPLEAAERKAFVAILAKLVITNNEDSRAPLDVGRVNAG